MNITFWYHLAKGDGDLHIIDWYLNIKAKLPVSLKIAQFPNSCFKIKFINTWNFSTEPEAKHVFHL